jgi:dsDNA-specific endonuclease/ATPase MutS2
MAGMKLKLDLHNIYNRGGDIDRALRAIIKEAVTTKAPLVEIIPGKGSGALKKRVLAFWSRKRSNLSTTGWRRTRITSAGSFVHFRWK